LTTAFIVLYYFYVARDIYSALDFIVF